MKHNVNDMCTAVLTESGVDAWHAHYVESSLKPHQWPRAPIVGDTVRMPLWELARIFGPHMYCGGDPVFRNNAFQIEDCHADD